MNAVFDLAARRSAQPRDKASIMRDLDAGAVSLCAQFSSWPHRFLKEADIVGAERSLSALRVLVAELRGKLPPGGDA